MSVLIAVAAASTLMPAPSVGAAAKPGYVYTCADSEPACVKNFNRERFNGQKTVNIVRVTTDGPDTASMSSIKGNVNQLSNFYEAASRGQFSLKVVSETTVKVAPQRSCQRAENEATRQGDTNAYLNVYVFPNGMCKGSHAGGHRVFLSGNLYRNLAHEAGHVLGLGHANKNLNGNFDGYGDPSSLMGSMPSLNYNLPQLHWLGWTKKDDVVNVTGAVDKGLAVEVKIRPLDRNVESDSSIPLGAVYDIPGTDTRLWIAIPMSANSGFNAVNGGDVYVYRAPKCNGCTGISMGTTIWERFDSKTSKDHVSNGGITVNPIRFEAEQTNRDGKKINKFTSVTLRISKTV